MAGRTFCRPKVQTQKPCSAAEGLEIVQDILTNGSLGLSDDLRVNLHIVSGQLEFLKEFANEIRDGGAVDRRKLAATSPIPAVTVPGSAAQSNKKDNKHGKNENGTKEVTQPVTSDKKHKMDGGREGKEGHKKGDGKEEDVGTEGKEDKKDKERKERKERKKDKEAKEGKKHREGKDKSRKRRSEEVVEGGKDSVRKSKKQKVAA